MTLEINFDNGFVDRNQGGNISASNDILTCEGVGGINVCREFYFPIFPGGKVKVSTLAKAFKGIGVVAITFFSSANQSLADVQYQIVDRDSFTPYTIEAVAPYNNNLATVRISLGKFSIHGDDSKLSYKGAHLAIENDYANKYVLASGMISLSAAGEGTVTLNNSFRSTGVQNVSKLDDQTIKVTLKSKFRNENRPKILCTGTTDLKLTIGVEKINENSFNIKLTSGNDFQTLKRDAGLFFEVSY